ncbi:MAG TPA: 50S ribosomal protein L11 methyltransferase [Armatimonadota bacterium]|jgi:ribosomal protein L11 methyltransferase
MRWAEISVETNDQGRDAVSNLMIENGCGGVVISNEAPIVVKGYLPVDDRLEDRLLRIKAGTADLPKFGLEIGSGEMTITYAEDQDWAEAWKQFFRTTRVGSRTVIKPTWDEYTDPQLHDILIELDPGMAFGTGSHQTTRLCLISLEKYMRSRKVVIDFGTGSGILAIAAAKLKARLVIAFDSDDLAVKAARENVLRNEVEHIVEVHRAESPSFIGDGAADIVTANIVAETIMASAEEIARILKTGGMLIASGITTGKALDVEQVLRNLGFDIAETLTDGEWVAIVAIKAG